MSVRIDLEKCIGCGTCYRECPNDIIGWNDITCKPFIAYPDECGHCGVCKLECKSEAIIHIIPLACYDDYFEFGPSTNKPTTFDWRKYVQHDAKS